MSENFTAADFAQASFARHPDLGLATRDGGINDELWMDIEGNECDDSGMALYGWTPVVEADSETLREYREQRRHDMAVLADRDKRIEEQREEIDRLAGRALRAKEEAASLALDREQALNTVNVMEAQIQDLRESKDSQEKTIFGQLTAIRDLRERLDGAARERDVAEEARRDATEDMVRERERAVEAEKALRDAQRDVDDLHQEVDRLERILQAPLSLKDLQAAWEAAEEADTCNAGDVLIVRDALDVFTVWVTPGRNRVDADTRILSRAPREPWADLADVLRAWDAEPADADADGMAKWFHERGVRVTGGDDDE